MLLEPPRQEAGNLEPVANDFGCSHGLKIMCIGDSSLAGRANLLAKRANERFGVSEFRGHILHGFPLRPDFAPSLSRSKECADSVGKPSYHFPTRFYVKRANICVFCDFGFTVDLLNFQQNRWLRESCPLG